MLLNILAIYTSHNTNCNKVFQADTVHHLRKFSLYRARVMASEHRLEKHATLRRVLNKVLCYVWPDSDQLVTCENKLQ